MSLLLRKVNPFWKPALDGYYQRVHDGLYIRVKDHIVAHGLGMRRTILIVDGFRMRGGWYEYDSRVWTYIQGLG